MDARKFDGRLSEHLLDLPSISVNFPCMYRTIRQFQVLREDFPSSNGAITAFSSTSSVSTRPSCNFWCGNNTFHQFPVWQWHFPSTSAVAVAFLVCQLELTSPSVHRRDPLSISSAPTVLSFVCPRNHPSTFHASLGPSVNFNQQSVQPRDHL